MNFLNNKYTKWYFSIVKNASSRTLTNVYIERHHVVPKSLGGSNDVSNLVKLTAREHFICHRLLTKMTSGIDKMKMHKAAMLMTVMSTNQGRIKIPSRTYQILRENAANATKSLPRKPLGKITDPDILQRIRTMVIEREKKYKSGELTRTPRTFTEEHKDQLRAAIKSRKGMSTNEQSEEARERAARNISKAKKGKPAWNKGIPRPKFCCILCGKETDAANCVRYHGIDKCN